MAGTQLTRRKFLAAGTAAAIAVPGILRAQGSPNRLNIAIIRCGERGGAFVAAVSSGNIVALGGVTAAAVEAAAAKFPKARRTNDLRTLFDNPKDFAAVVVSTCEHTHAFATVLALRHNRHVYCEKPLTNGIWEARQV